LGRVIGGISCLRVFDGNGRARKRYSFGDGSLKTSEEEGTQARTGGGELTVPKALRMRSGMPYRADQGERDKRAGRIHWRNRGSRGSGGLMQET